MTYTQTGRIIKMTGGLYTVRLDGGCTDSPLTGQTVECRARGNFRHEQMTPLVGDLVAVQYDDTSFTRADGVATPSADRTGLVIDDILPRKNSLIRPPLANLDTMLVVIAAASPDPDIPTVDKLLKADGCRRVAFEDRTMTVAALVTPSASRTKKYSATPITAVGRRQIS